MTRSEELKELHDARKARRELQHEVMIREDRIRELETERDAMRAALEDIAKESNPFIAKRWARAVLERFKK